MIRTVRKHGCLALWAGIMVCAVSGCRMVQTRSAAAPPRSAGAITRIVVLWSEAVLRQDNTPVAQGFAGKLYLFGEANSPVTAPGKFTIYAYDDTGAAMDTQKAAHVKPDFTWELSEADMKDLLKKDAIGWSYSLWLPCGAPANTERRYTVLVRFSPENGPPVLSESTLVTLPPIRVDRNTALAQPQSMRTPTAGESQANGRR